MSMTVQARTAPTGTLADLATGFPARQIWRGRVGRGTDQGWFVPQGQCPSAAEAVAGPLAMLSASDAISRSGLVQQASQDRAGRGSAMRFRGDRSADVARAGSAVVAWRRIPAQTPSRAQDFSGAQAAA